MKHNLDILMPLRQTMEKRPGDTEKIMHQTLALCLYQDLDNNKVDFESVQLVGCWIEQGFYRELSANKITNKLDNVSMLTAEICCAIAGKYRWKTLKLKIKLYLLKKSKIHMFEILNYMFMTYHQQHQGIKLENNLTNFYEFLRTVNTTPKKYFNETEKK